MAPRLRGPQRARQPTTASPTSSGCPSRQPPWPGIADHPRRRLAEGEPRRLRPRCAGRPAGRRSPTTSAATAQSEGEMSPAAVADAGRDGAACSARLDGVDAGRVCVRGSSMGGFIAIHAAAGRTRSPARSRSARPASELLLAGIRRGGLEMRAVDATRALDAWLGEHDLRDAVDLLGASRCSCSRRAATSRSRRAGREELYERAADPRKLIVVPGRPPPLGPARRRAPGRRAALDAARPAVRDRRAEWPP